MCRTIEGVRWVLLASLAAVLLGAPPRDAQAFLDSINPFADTKDEFEGKFIESLEPRAWVPPLERLERERQAAAGSAGGGAADGRPGEDDGYEAAPAKSEDAPAEPARVKVPDGLTLLRMTGDWVSVAPALEDYMNGIGARLLAHSPITGAPVRYYVTAVQDFGLAKAMPDGAIGIPIEVIDKVETEDELAFMLAHEAAHVLLEHHDNDWFQELNQRFVSAAEAALGMSAALAGQYGDASLEQTVFLASLAADGLLFVTDMGLFPSFTREQEDEADLLGFDLMIAAGYNSQEAFVAMEKMQSWEESAAQIKAARTAEKRAEIDREMSDAADRGDLNSAIGGLFKGLGLAANDVSEDMSESHRDAEARLDSLFDYYFREHEAEDPAPQTRNITLSQLRNTAEVKALLDSHRNAWTALSLVAKDDLAGAQSLARAAVSGAMKSDSLARFAFFKTRLKQGRQDKAITNLEIALKGTRPSFEIYRQLANMYWGTGRKNESMKVLGAAFEEFDKPPPLYPELIYRHFALGDSKKANALALECALQYRDLRELCQKASHGQAPDLAQ